MNGQSRAGIAPADFEYGGHRRRLFRIRLPITGKGELGVVPVRDADLPDGLLGPEGR